jgi:hypothetical protein
MTNLPSRLAGTAFGLVLIAVGVLIVLNRQTIWEWIVGEQEARFGRLGLALSRRSRPSALLYPGIGAILMGLLVMVLSWVAPHVEFVGR